MRAAIVILVALVMGACASPPTATPPTATPPTATPLTSAPASPSPSIVATGLLARLPMTVNGVATTRTSLTMAGRTTPRVYLRILGRIGKTPPDAQLALAFASGATVYGMQVDGTSGSEIVQAFLEERAGAAPGSSPPPTVSIGDKQVVRLGSFVGTFLYGTDDTFYYVEAPDEATAADVLQQLP